MRGGFYQISHDNGRSAAVGNYGQPAQRFINTGVKNFGEIKQGAQRPHTKNAGLPAGRFKHLAGRSQRSVCEAMASEPRLVQLALSATTGLILEICLAVLINLAPSLTPSRYINTALVFYPAPNIPKKVIFG